MNSTEFFELLENYVVNNRIDIAKECICLFLMCNGNVIKYNQEIDKHISVYSPDEDQDMINEYLSHKIDDRVYLLKKYGFGGTTTHSLGGGEWSIEVMDASNTYLFELVGSNGTRDGEEADDLNGELSMLLKRANV